MKTRKIDLTQAAANAAKCPPLCYASLPTDPNSVIVIKRGESGYYPQPHLTVPDGKGPTRAAVLNSQLGVTTAQAEAMFAGSMFGWDCPGANPDHASYKTHG